MNRGSWITVWTILCSRLPGQGYTHTYNDLSSGIGSVVLVSPPGKWISDICLSVSLFVAVDLQAVAGLKLICALASLSAGSTDAKPLAMPSDFSTAFCLSLRLQQGSDKGCGHLYRDRRSVSDHASFPGWPGADRQRRFLQVAVRLRTGSF